MIVAPILCNSEEQVLLQMTVVPQTPAAFSDTWCPQDLPLKELPRHLKGFCLCPCPKMLLFHSLSCLLPSSLLRLLKFVTQMVVPLAPMGYSFDTFTQCWELHANSSLIRDGAFSALCRRAARGPLCPARDGAGPASGTLRALLCWSSASCKQHSLSARGRKPRAARETSRQQ